MGGASGRFDQVAGELPFAQKPAQVARQFSVGGQLRTRKDLRHTRVVGPVFKLERGLRVLRELSNNQSIPELSNEMSVFDKHLRICELFPFVRCTV
jgi:hypothetical protein